MPVPHRSVFTVQMPFLPPNQQHQSTEVTPEARVQKHKINLGSWLAPLLTNKDVSFLKEGSYTASVCRVVLCSTVKLGW